MTESIYPIFPKLVTVEVDERRALSFCVENHEALIEYIAKSNESIISDFIDDNKEAFDEFVLSGGMYERF